jgi:hypothetical protein
LIKNEEKMVTNFEIMENYALTFEGRHIDLHNNFDFVDYKYDVMGQKLTMYWVKTQGEWVKKDEIEKFELVHKGVTYLAMHTETLTAIQERTLEDITYFPSNERHTNDCMVWQSKPKIDDDILYLFGNEAFMRVHCEEIKFLEVLETPQYF